MIKRILITLFIVIWASVPLQAQDRKTDKLLLELSQAKEDTLKVFLLNDLNEAFLDESEPEQALIYGFKALETAKKIHFQRGTAITYTNLGLTYSFQFDNYNALKMHYNALKINQKLKRTNAIIDSYVNIGVIYDAQGNFSQSMKHYLLALRNASKGNNYELKGDIHQNLGITFSSLGNTSEALNHHLKALKNYEKINHELSIADVYNSLGNVYADKQEYEAAYKMYGIALNKFSKCKESYGLANVYVNLGILLTEQNKIANVDIYYTNALRVYLDLKDVQGQIITYNSLGNTYFKQNKLELAESKLLQALKLAESVDDVVEVITSKIGLATIYNQQGKLQEARACANFAFDAAKEIRHKASIRNALSVLKDIETKAKNYKLALEFQQLYSLYKDSINNEDTKRKGQELMMTYAFQKRIYAMKSVNERRVSDLKKQQVLEVRKKQIYAFVLIFLLMSGLVTGYFARKSNKNAKKVAELLQNENEHKELLLQEVHHRVNNSLQMISSLLAIQADATESSEIKEYLSKSENRVQSMSIIHRLLHLGNSKLEVNMNSYLSEVLSLYNKLSEDKPDIQIDAHVPDVFFHTKTAMPLALILNEAITNSFKYAFQKKKGRITIKLENIAGPNTWRFQIADDGTGFDLAVAEQNSESLGIDLIRLMSKQMNAELSISVANGTVIELIFVRNSA